MLTRQRVRARVGTWQRRLGLTHWTIRVVFAPKERHAAHCAVEAAEWDADYLEATLYFDLARVPEADLDGWVLHELCTHTVWWPLGDLALSLAGKNRRLRRLVLHAEEQSAVLLERVLRRAYGLPDG